MKSVAYNTDLTIGVCRQLLGEPILWQGTNRDGTPAKYTDLRRRKFLWKGDTCTVRTRHTIPFIKEPFPQAYRDVILRFRTEDGQTLVEVRKRLSTRYIFLSIVTIFLFHLLCARGELLGRDPLLPFSILGFFYSVNSYEKRHEMALTMEYLISTLRLCPVTPEGEGVSSLQRQKTME